MQHQDSHLLLNYYLMMLVAYILPEAMILEALLALVGDAALLLPCHCLDHLWRFVLRMGRSFHYYLPVQDEPSIPPGTSWSYPYSSWS